MEDIKEQTFKLSSVSYDKRPEQIVRDILNENLKIVRTTCNSDIYKFDLKVWERGRRNHLGYIEVEVSKKGWLKDYYELSFLERKILHGCEEKNGLDTIYIKFKNDYSCFFCASMMDIVNCNEAELSYRTGKNRNLSTRTDRYISIPMNRIDIIRYTPEKVFSFIDDHFSRMIK